MMQEGKREKKEKERERGSEWEGERASARTRYGYRPIFDSFEILCKLLCAAWFSVHACITYMYAYHM